jgi:hypothetical protein
MQVPEPPMEVPEPPTEIPEVLAYKREIVE